MGRERTLNSKKMTGWMWFGLAMLIWPMVAVFLSGLLFGQGNLGTAIARASGMLAYLFGTMSMLIGTISLVIFIYLRCFSKPRNSND